MFFPYADDNPPEARFPWMNWLLILANVGIFVMLGMRPDYERIVMHYGFTPIYFRTETLFTSMFLHGGLAHLAGNMWFLYLFGDNVENRCGPFKYLFCYLLCGVAGDLSHYMFFPNSAIPSIGASGAIAGVLGMYLFFFPYNRVRMLVVLIIFIQTISISALWAIGLWFLLEVFYGKIQSAAGVEGGVGHLAHSGGFVAGFFLAALFTAMNWVRNEGDHLWAVLTGGGRPKRSPYLDEAPVAQGGYGRHYGSTEVLPASVDDPRGKIVALLHAGRSDEARRAWRKYAFDNHAGVLPVREQLEVALALDKNGERSAARDAYERLIDAYSNEQPYAAEASLALAGMLLQELKESGDEREVPIIESLLRRVAQTHPYPNRRELAEKWLQAIGA